MTSRRWPARVSPVCLFAVLLAYSSAASSARAAFIAPPIVQQLPDITSHFVSVQYAPDANSTTGTFTADGYAEAVNNVHPIDDGHFLLEMVVDRATGASISGTLTIDGTADDYNAHSGHLLSGTLLGAASTYQEFGFHDPLPGNPPPQQGVFDHFEFIFQGLGGDLAALMGPRVGIDLDAAFDTADPSQVTFSGRFNSPFYNDGFSGDSDTFHMAGASGPETVPEPASWLSFGACLGLAGIWRLLRGVVRRSTGGTVGS